MSDRRPTDDVMARELIAARARIAELEHERDALRQLVRAAAVASVAAQRPPLGYVTVDLQSENPPSLIEADREIASQQLADDRAASPLGDWVLLEVREVQP